MKTKPQRQKKVCNYSFNEKHEINFAKTNGGGPATIYINIKCNIYLAQNKLERN